MVARANNGIDCDWCYTKLDNTYIWAARESRITFSGNPFPGEPHTEWLYFCCQEHRQEYFFGF